MMIARVLAQEITSKGVEDLGELLCINYQVSIFCTDILNFLIVQKSKKKSVKQYLFYSFFDLYNC